MSDPRKPPLNSSAELSAHLDGNPGRNGEGQIRPDRYPVVVDVDEPKLRPSRSVPARKISSSVSPGRGGRSLSALRSRLIIEFMLRVDYLVPRRTCRCLTWPDSAFNLSGSSLGVPYIRPVTHSCPCCDGKGRVGYGRSGQSIICYLCDGTGQVTELVFARAERGRELSRLRANAGVSLRELAKQASLNPTVLSDVEHGRAEASDHVTAVYARFRKPGRRVFDS